MKRYVRPLLFVLFVLFFGAMICWNISLDLATWKRQSTNEAMLDRLDGTVKEAHQLVNEVDPDHKNFDAFKHLIQAESALFHARMDNSDKHGYCSVYQVKNEINAALKTIGREWTFDDSGKKIKEDRFDEGKLLSTTAFNYGSDGRVSSSVSKFTDGQTFAEEFFVNGTRTLARHYGAGCGVGMTKWKPQFVYITVYQPDGKRRQLEQQWSLDESGKASQLGSLQEFDDTGKPLRDWSFGVFVAREEDDPAGAGKVPTELNTWQKNPSALVVELLRADGSVRERTTYVSSDDLNRKPLVEKFNGQEGGVRKVNQALLRLPEELIKY